MKKLSKISVLLTLKNSSTHVRKAVKGYINQSVKPMEIIIVGLKGDLANIADLVAVSSKPKIRLFEFVGLKNDARNFAFLKSEGEYVLIADYDMIPSKKLIEECEMGSRIHNALIIPEVGENQRSLKGRIFKLEKQIVANDEGSVTPRFFKRMLFSKYDLPFDSRYGVLDEWGFYVKLRAKSPKIGTTTAYFTVRDELSYVDRFIKNFNKGRYFHNLLVSSKKDSRRLNPIRRGVNIFVLNSNYFLVQPIEFICLMILKFMDLMVFTAGYTSKAFTRL